MADYFTSLAQIKQQGGNQRLSLLANEMSRRASEKRSSDAASRKFLADLATDPNYTSESRREFLRTKNLGSLVTRKEQQESDRANNYKTWKQSLVDPETGQIDSQRGLATLAQLTPENQKLGVELIDAYNKPAIDARKRQIEDQRLANEQKRIDISMQNAAETKRYHDMIQARNTSAKNKIVNADYIGAKSYIDALLSESGDFMSRVDAMTLENVSAGLKDLSNGKNTGLAQFALQYGNGEISLPDFSVGDDETKIMQGMAKKRIKSVGEPELGNQNIDLGGLSDEEIQAEIEMLQNMSDEELMRIAGQ